MRQERTDYKFLDTVVVFVVVLFLFSGLFGTNRLS